MPYRLDLPGGRAGAFEKLVELGALDIEISSGGGIAVLLPDSAAPEHVAQAVGAETFSVSPASGRDDGSVWILNPRPIRVGRLQLVPAHMAAGPGIVRLVDSAAFGTGFHPTTALCLEALDAAVLMSAPPAVLDVGTGSGVLALAALTLGVPQATGIDLDNRAIAMAGENARLNAVEERLRLARGGPASIAGQWPLVLANVLAAPLIDMAPALVQRVARRGQLVLSGIPCSLEAEVERVYLRLGMQHVRRTSRAGWAALWLRASW